MDRFQSCTSQRSCKFWICSLWIFQEDENKSKSRSPSPMIDDLDDFERRDIEIDDIDENLLVLKLFSIVLQIRKNLIQNIHLTIRNNVISINLLFQPK